MNTTDLSKTIQRQSDEYGLTVEEMAFITLNENGWSEHDALKFLELVPGNGSTSSIRIRVDKIKAKEGYEKYINENNEYTQRTRGNKQLRDKDAVLKAMEKEANSMSGLDKIRALKEIAELQQMKKEKTKEQEDLVHFFLPLTCNYCSLYMEHQKKIRNDD